MCQLSLWDYVTWCLTGSNVSCLFSIFKNLVYCFPVVPLWISMPIWMCVCVCCDVKGWWCEMGKSTRKEGRKGGSEGGRFRIPQCPSCGRRRGELLPPAAAGVSVAGAAAWETPTSSWADFLPACLPGRLAQLTPGLFLLLLFRIISLSLPTLQTYQHSVQQPHHTNLNTRL